MLCAIPIVREVVPTDVNIVRLVVEEGKSLNEVATHLDIARSLLQRWKEQLAAKPGAEVFPGHGRLAPQAQRVRDLEKQLREVTQERDILKKRSRG